MSKKEEYIIKNKEYIKAKASEEGYNELPGGVLYKIIDQGNGGKSPDINSVVTVHYRGLLVGGRLFDSSYRQGYPLAIRLKDVIDGWQIALTHMHVGDKWNVVIPSELGYGRRAAGDIPGNSTLIFDIELLGIG